MMISDAFVGMSRVLGGAAVTWRCDPCADAQRIYFANHSSHLDFVVIWSALPPPLRRLARPVAGRDYWEHDALRRYVASEVFHAVLIDRGRGVSDREQRSARAAIQSMADGLGHRHSLILFPEGTRSLNGELGTFKSGLYHLARLRPDVELIPVRVDNLHRILPKGESVPVPMLSRVVFGSPFAAVTGDGKHQFLQRARDALLDLKAAS
jgi:1-acyl-sn-glycerol-3-phosphate acyltransferase